jgi:hypothetical protein
VDVHLPAAGDIVFVDRLAASWRVGIVFEADQEFRDYLNPPGYPVFHR